MNIDELAMATSDDAVVEVGAEGRSGEFLTGRAGILAGWAERSADSD